MPPTSSVAAEDWSLESVVRRLRAQSDAEGQVRAQVFLDRSAGNDVAAAARRLLHASSEAMGEGAEPQLEKVHRLARSFAVRGSADAIEVIGRQPGVRAVLPAEIDDIQPKPIAKRAG